MSIFLVGAGGHAKVLADILEARNIKLSGYIDPRPAAWLEKRGVAQVSDRELEKLLPANPRLIMGFVGLDCAALKKRLDMMENYVAQGAVFPNIMHPGAVVSPYAAISPQGVQILPGAVVNSDAFIGPGAVINTGAVVEHDAQVENGAHIAPNATVLGGAKIGCCAYISGGSVVDHDARVPAQFFVKSLSFQV